MPKTRSKRTTRSSSARHRVASSSGDATLPATECLSSDSTSETGRCSCAADDAQLSTTDAQLSTTDTQLTTIDTQFTTTEATSSTRYPPHRRLLQLESQLEDLPRACSCSLQQHTSGGERAAKDPARRGARLQNALWFLPRLRIPSKTRAGTGRLTSFVRRNKSNLVTSLVAAFTVFLLVPLCVVYYMAGTMAAGFPRKGAFLAGEGLDMGLESETGFETGTCKDFHPLASSVPVYAELSFANTGDFVPYRTKAVSANAIFCVYQNDVFLRFPKLRYRVVDVPGAYCTHLIYHSAGVTADGSIYSKDPTFDEAYQGYRQAAELKTVYPHLKVLLSLGGGPDDRDTFQFSSVARDLNRTRTFADRAYWWLVNRGFDGVHLDWRRPGGPCGSRSDKHNFLTLVETLRERFGLRYIITVGVPYQDSWRYRGYHLPGIADQADFLLATTHGFHNASERHTHCLSPYSAPASNGASGRGKPRTPGTGPTVQEVLRRLKHEVPREHRQRLCFSVSLKAQHWTLRSSGAFHLGSPARKAAPATGGSQAQGLVEYPLVCKYMLRDSLDAEGLCNYAVRFRDFVTYEGTKSLPVKLSRMRRDMGTPGLCLAVWDLAFDDFKGDCGMSRSPLLRAINKALSSRTKPWMAFRASADNG